MTWKTNFRSIYYQGAPEPDDLVLPHAETALLVIDVQNTYLSGQTGHHFPPPNRKDTTPGQPFTNACTSRSFPGPPNC